MHWSITSIVVDDPSHDVGWDSVSMACVAILTI